MQAQGKEVFEGRQKLFSGSTEGLLLGKVSPSRLLNGIVQIKGASW